ncbi:MAG: hypothetical protein ACJ8M4_06855 [Chthoniobacterales bacterium]
MRKLTGMALMAALAFAVGPAFAGDKDKDHSCCATGEKMDSASFTKLNLSAEQKAKMDALLQKCNKDGCTKESMEAFIKSAESVLSKEQMATLKTECNRAHDKGSKA